MRRATDDAHHLDPGAADRLGVTLPGESGSGNQDFQRVSGRSFAEVGQRRGLPKGRRAARPFDLWPPICVFRLSRGADLCETGAGILITPTTRRRARV